jgi:hypothetical protein
MVHQVAPLLNVISRLLVSKSAGPKVIIISGFHCISDWVFRNLDTWNNCDIQRLKGRLHDGDYMLTRSWTSSLQRVRIHSAVSLKLSKYHECWNRDVMFVLIQHSCAHVKEVTTKHLPTMRFWSNWSMAKCKTHDTEIRMALKICQRGVTFTDPGVACINDA